MLGKVTVDRLNEVSVCSDLKSTAPFFNEVLSVSGQVLALMVLSLIQRHVSG